MTRALPLMLFLVLVFRTGTVLGDGLPELPTGLEEESDVPGLPSGLDDEESEGPGLPEGLGGDDDGPGLPEGLEDDDTDSGRDETAVESSWLDGVREFGLRGYLDLRGGVRLQDDPWERDASLGEIRLQLGLTKDIGEFRFDLVGDLVYDTLAETHEIDLERGEGWFDLRQASVSVSATDFMDVKVGRQVLTWGTGDLLFLNDLFPKDWPSFLVGRDTDYLKAPSDAIKLGFFSDLVNLDVVYTPRFDSDRHITGERVSYWNNALGRRAGRHDPFSADRPDEALTDDEIACRLYRPVGSFEVALYGYHGFYKSPAGMDPMTGKAIFPALAVYGASVRGPLAGGIVNAEVAWYDSLDDRDGDDPFVENGQLRLLVGFERDVPEIAHDLTLGVQWYVESMHDYSGYRDGVPPGAPKKDATRHVGTLRVTKRLMAQTLDLSAILFVSPTDGDGYLRMSANYAIDDHWSAFAGLDVWFGDDDHTFYAQFERNTSLHAGVRWSF